MFCGKKINALHMLFYALFSFSKMFNKLGVSLVLFHLRVAENGFAFIFSVY